MKVPFLQHLTPVDLMGHEFEETTIVPTLYTDTIYVTSDPLV